MKKVAILVFGSSTSPEEVFYKRYENNWKSLLEADIDYDELAVFYCQTVKDTFLEEQAQEVLIYCKARIEYSDSVDRFAFQSLGSLLHARFRIKAIL